jgi:hypothetical protein
VARRSSTVLLAIAVVVVTVVGVSAGVLIGRRSRMSVVGSVSAEGTSVGNLSFAVDHCLSGQTLTPKFFGVDLRAEGGFAMSVVGSGDGAHLRLFSKGGRQGSIAIQKQVCTWWEVLVERPPSAVDRAPGMRGRVKVACTVGGGTVKADVVFDRCPD